MGKVTVGSVEYKVLDAINGALKLKSKGKFWLDLRNAYAHPNCFGAAVEDDGEKISRAIALEQDLENVVARSFKGYTVAFCEGPLRIVVNREKVAPVTLFDWWPTVAKMAVNTFAFNGVLLYDIEQHLLNIGIVNNNAHAGFFGATGSGKTNLMTVALLTMAMRNSPQKLTVVACDPAGRNLTFLRFLPHCGAKIAVATEDCEGLIHAVRVEMDRRSKFGTGLDEDGNPTTRILLVVDEINRLATESPQIVADLAEIGKIGRQLGVHMWVSGQKMTKEIPTILSGNIVLRFTGRVQVADARLTSGEGSNAHKLPVNQGAFEINNGGTILGKQCPVRVQGLHIKPNEVNYFLQQIVGRWGARPTHFRPTILKRDLEDIQGNIKPEFALACLERKPGITVWGVRKLHQEMFGVGMGFKKAVTTHQWVMAYST